MTNCIAIRPAVKKQSLGVSLDLVTSLINHDCQPNIFVFFEGDELRARSIRSISAGEELTRCYCDPTMDVLLRQHVLKAEQFFECNCEPFLRSASPQGNRRPAGLTSLLQVLGARTS
jgi:hypothetical protein